MPVVLVSGVDDAAMEAVGLALQLGLPNAVGVRHTIDAERQVLTRVVSDITGVLEREEISLAHVCVACAIREDIVPTLERLGAARKWQAIVACLPLAAEADQVSRVVALGPSQAPDVRIATVVAALDGATVDADLVGSDLLAERRLATSPEDRRGVAEVAAAIVEYADLICFTQAPDDRSRALVAALARPGAVLSSEPTEVDAAELLADLRSFDHAEAWVSDVRRDPLPALLGRGAWRLDLRSERPFHPLRFRDELTILGGGATRSRGCFWLPTRPDDVCVWAGAGGQASIGSSRPWGRSAPFSRIVVVGFDEDLDGRSQIRAAFERSLVSDAEAAARGLVWRESWDGFEPWLGPIENVA